MKILTWQQIDATSRKIKELQVDAPGTVLTEDGSFGPNMRFTMAWLSFEGNVDSTNMAAFSEFLKNDLGCLGKNVETRICNFMLRLPPGHHMTPGHRIDTVMRAVANAFGASQIEEVDSELDLDGTAPTGGIVARVINRWNVAVAREAWGLPSPVQDRHIFLVQSSLVACGFNTPALKIDGIWYDESQKSLENVVALGRELEEAGIKAGDPHTLYAY